ncbi:MAG: septum formation initiator family protein [Clostridiales bacterium]|jgi:cell division protein DivIC|nr:septum formation initiator family protein [Clostridiales bacterium]
MRLKYGFAGVSLRISFRLFLWAAMIVFFAYISYLNLIKLNTIKTVEAGIQNEIDAENEKTAELQQTQQYQESDEYYEKVAREQLGLVKPDEIIFIAR